MADPEVIAFPPPPPPSVPPVPKRKTRAPKPVSPPAPLPAPKDVPPAEPPIEPLSVVQCINPQSPHFGVLFTVGGVSNDSVHGYYISVRGKKEWVTVAKLECKRIGRIFLASREPVSPEWKAQHPTP